MLANNPSRFETRALACLVFRVIDDAMGTPTENLEPADAWQNMAICDCECPSVVCCRRCQRIRGQRRASRHFARQKTV